MRQSNTNKKIESVEAYPLDWPDKVRWPRTENPERSNFYTTTSGGTKRKRTVEEGRIKVENEIGRLGGRNIVISTNIKLRKDGKPYASAAEPDDSGVAVYFMLNGDPRCIPCDKWEKVGCNLHAIAKTINSLRGIDRWGTEKIIEAAFSGFKALPESGSGVKWWDVLGVTRDARGEQIKKAFKKKVKTAHPDSPSGSSEQFKIVRDAYQQGMNTNGED